MQARSQSTHQRPVTADSSMHARAIKSIDHRHSSHHRQPVPPAQHSYDQRLSLSDHSNQLQFINSPTKAPINVNGKGIYPHVLEHERTRMAHMSQSITVGNMNNGSSLQRIIPSNQQYGVMNQTGSPMSRQRQGLNMYNNVQGPTNRNIRSASAPRTRPDGPSMPSPSIYQISDDSNVSVPWAVNTPTKSTHRRQNVPNHPPPPLSNGAGSMMHPMNSPHRPRPDHVMPSPFGKSMQQSNSHDQRPSQNQLHHSPNLNTAIPINRNAIPMVRQRDGSMVGNVSSIPRAPSINNSNGSNHRPTVPAHKRPSLQRTTKDVLMYFNTNGSAKHTDHRTTSNMSCSDDSVTTANWPPRPINGSAGSKMRIFFGVTCREFVVLFHEDDGDKSWQSKVWCNIPIGLDSKLRTIDRVEYCSFTENEWFILTYCEQMQKYKSTWSVESQPLHVTLSAYAQSNTPVRLALGENGQYVILHGTNGYQVGPNTPTQLQIALDRAYSNGDKILSVIGLNSHGRFLMHATRKALDDSNHSNGEKKERNIFCALGLSTQLDQMLKNINKLEYSDFILSVKDTSYLIVRDDTFDRTDDIHYDLVTELDGFYARHQKRQSKRSEEIENFYLDKRAGNITAVDTQALTKAASVDQISNTTKDDVKENANKLIERVEQEPRDVSTNIAVKDPQGKKKAKALKKQQKLQQKKVKPSILRARNLLEKEDRLSEIIRKGIVVGDKITAIGISSYFGDIVVQSIEPTDGSIVAKKKSTAVTIADIRTVTKFDDGEKLTEYSGFFQGSLPADTYEAAMQLYHLYRKGGACDCKNNFFGSMEHLQQSSMWKTGDRVNVVGYADGIVIHSKPKYSDNPNLVHVQYDDGSSYHVRTDKVRPIKRYEDPGKCYFTSIRSIEESALRLRPILDETKIGPFDEYKCAEKVDLRRLQKLIANVRSDSNQRKECMKQLVAQLIQNPDDLSADDCYSQLEHCYDLEEALYVLFEKIKSLPMDEKGCVVHEVQYSHKDLTCYGRLFAIGPSVRVLHDKFPRTATIQGLHPELRAHLVGAFSHEIQFLNSHVQLLCSLAQQLEMDDKIPTLQDYRDNTDQWIVAIRLEHPNVPLSAIHYLVRIIICGGTYETWLEMVGECDAAPKLKRFGFCLASETLALCDQIIQCPRFHWTFLEQKKLESMGLPNESIKTILLTKILHACENVVLGIVHRTFHDNEWIVRVKIFDCVIVEYRHVEGRNIDKPLSLEQIMRLAEKQCHAMNWNVQLVEKKLHGYQDQPLKSFIKARTSMRQYMHKLSRNNKDEDESSLEHDDDDLITTVTRSVGDDAFSADDSNSTDGNGNMCHILGASFNNSESFGDLRNESTFHSESDDSNDVPAIEVPNQNQTKG